MQFLIGVSGLSSGHTFKGQKGSSGLLRGVQWQFLIDVSGQPSGPTFKDQGALPSYYAAYNGISLSTFREYLAVPPSRVKGLSELLRSVQWQFLIDVSGLPSGPIFKGQGALLGYYAAYNGKSFSTFRDNLSAPLKIELIVFPKRRQGITTVRCVKTQKSADLFDQKLCAYNY